MNNFITTLSLKVYDPRLTSPEEDEDVLCIQVFEKEDGSQEFLSVVCRFFDGEYHVYDEYAWGWIWERRPDLWARLPDKETLRDLWLGKG